MENELKEYIQDKNHFTILLAKMQDILFENKYVEKLRMTIPKLSLSQVSIL